MSEMKVIVVIGGIGSGKSSVSHALEQRGAAFIDLDGIGHQVILHDEVIRELVHVFGRDILDQQGAIIRPKLAAEAFSSPEGTRMLNKITHPKLIADAQEELAACSDKDFPAAVMEISPYDGPYGEFGIFTDMADAVIAVLAPEDLRVKRSVANGFEEADVRNRMSRQVTDDQRREWADYIVENDGSLADLEQLVDSIWKDVVG